jgi:hypothetical protein
MRGMRKTRVGLGTRGKRSGLRLWYVYLEDRQWIVLIYALPKNRGSDLTKAMEQQLVAAVQKELP